MYSVFGRHLCLVETNRIPDHEKERVARFIGWLSRYTFAIYLEQFLLLDIIPMITGVDTKLLVYRLVAPFVMIPIMIGGTWLLRKVPGIRRLVP